MKQTHHDIQHVLDIYEIKDFDYIEVTELESLQRTNNLWAVNEEASLASSKLPTTVKVHEEAKQKNIAGE